MLCSSIEAIPTSLPFIHTRRYGPLRGPTSSSCGGLRPLAKGFFGPLCKKKNLLCFWANFRQFWCPVVTLVTLKRIQKFQQKKTNKELKIHKKSEKQKKKKIQKINQKKNWENLWFTVCDSSDSSQVIKVSCPRSCMYSSGGLSSDAVACSVLCSNVHFTTQCTGWSTPVRHGPARNGQSPSQRCPSDVTQKNHFFFLQKIWKFWRKTILPEKEEENKCYNFSFPILGGPDSTRDLQSIPFQISGGVPWAWGTNEGRRTKDQGPRTKEILVSNLGFFFFIFQHYSHFTSYPTSFFSYFLL